MRIFNIFKKEKSTDMKKSDIVKMVRDFVDRPRHKDFIFDRPSNIVNSVKEASFNNNIISIGSNAPGKLIGEKGMTVRKFSGFVSTELKGVIKVEIYKV